MDYLNEQPLKLVFIVERPLPKSQKKSEQRQDLFQKRLGVTEPCHLQLSLTAKIVDFLQNARDNVFAEIVSADMSVYFAEKLTVEQFAPDMLLFPANALTRLRMFAMFASFEEAAPAIAPTMLPHRLMLLL